MTSKILLSKKDGTLTHEMIGDIIIKELEKMGFKLFYNDLYDYYSTIDFRKDTYKYNVMLVAKEDYIECSFSCYKNIFSVIFKSYNKQKISSFSETCKNILLNNGIIEDISIKG